MTTIRGNAMAGMSDNYDFPASLTREITRAFLGDLISHGVARVVYECIINPEWVVKVETRAAGVPGGLQSATEWLTWQEAKGKKKWAKWFAPCHFLSGSGGVLIQSRVDPIARPPKKIPNFCGDISTSNWGLLDGKPVMCDYGISSLIYNGLEGSSKLMKIEKET